MKLLVIIPIITKEFIKDPGKRVGAYVRPETKVDFANIDYGPASIESRYDHDMAAPFVVKKAEEAEKNGYDAIVVSCMMDPGVEAAKQAVNIPVVGSGEAGRQVAGLLGKNVKTVHARPLTVLQLIEDPEKAFECLLINGKKAIEDGADVLILGCTGLTGLAKRLQNELKVPILEGEGLALNLAQTMVDIGISQSKKAYPKPAEKKRILPD